MPEDKSEIAREERRTPVPSRSCDGESTHPSSDRNRSGFWVETRGGNDLNVAARAQNDEDSCVADAPSGGRAEGGNESNPKHRMPFDNLTEREQALRVAVERDVESRLAQKVRQDLVPRTVPRFSGFKIGNQFKPAPESGGDYLDFVPLLDKSWVVAIGDASGKGVDAALLMAQTRAYLRALALGHTDVGKILTLMNRRLVEDTLEEHYVTLFLARVLPESRSLVYSNAGHLPGFLIDSEGRMKKVLPCTGIPLGLDASVIYPKESGIAMQNGDRLLLFTDGITEAADSNKALFGVERAVKALRNHRSEEPDVVVQSLFDEVLAFTGGVQADDQTVMLLQVELPPDRPRTTEPEKT